MPFVDFNKGIEKESDIFKYPLKNAFNFFYALDGIKMTRRRGFPRLCFFTGFVWIFIGEASQDKHIPMAEINTGTPAGKPRAGVQRAKKLSTRVDLTPMVDLGFLLITFFIFTTSMSQPTAMKLRMPHDANDKTDKMHTEESGALTILMGKNNSLFYYFGLLKEDGSNLLASDYHAIREVIVTKKHSTKPTKFMVILKSHPSSTYRNAVDMLDEMYISDVKKYAFVEMEDLEQRVMLMQATH